MPLVRVEVRNEYGLGAPTMYMEAANDEEPKNILEGVAVAGLVGLLRQLAGLADFAAEVFHGLQEEVMMTCSRTRKLMVCVERIEAAVVSVEKAVLSQRSHLHFAYTAGVNWHAPARRERNHFVYSDMPQFIFDSYEDCRSPPQFQLLDRFDDGGPGSCLKRYSDPTIFNNASKASGDASTEKVDRYKKVENSKNQRSSWRKNGEVSQDASFPYHSGRIQLPASNSNVGGNAPPCQKISTYYAALMPELDERSNSDQRNESVCSKEDIFSSYSMQPKEEEVTSASGDILINLTDREKGICSSYSDNWREEPAMKDYDDDTNLESLLPRLDASQLSLVDDAFSFQTVDRLNVEKWNHTCVWGAIHLDDSGSETDHFSKSKIEDKAAEGRLPEHIKQKLKSQTSNSESNIVSDSLIGGVYNFRDNDSGMPIIGDSTNSHEPDEPVEETSKVTSVPLWTNGGLLGLQPSKPPLCSILNDLPQYSLSNEVEESSSSTQHVILHDRDPHVADYTRHGTSTQVNSELQDARNHPEITRSSPRMSELSSKLLSTLSDEEEDSSHASYLSSNAWEQRKNSDFAHQSSSSPPLAHMKISFQPIDGFMTSKLKLKFMDVINDQGSTDVLLPSFQLVPAVSSTRLTVGSDSDSDSDENAFYSRLSPSLSDDFQNHHSESSCEIKKSKSSNSQQQKGVPLNHDQSLATVNEQKSKAFSSEKTDVQREGNKGKNIDENNFLNQIRTKSMNLRPTVPAKPTLQTESSNNVQVMTILNKANAIRQAVGSDDGDNWSDT